MAEIEVQSSTSSSLIQNTQSKKELHQNRRALHRRTQSHFDFKPNNQCKEMSQSQSKGEGLFGQVNQKEKYGIKAQEQDSLTLKADIEKDSHFNIQNNTSPKLQFDQFQPPLKECSLEGSQDTKKQFHHQESQELKKQENQIQKLKSEKSENLLHQEQIIPQWTSTEQVIQMMQEKQQKQKEQIIETIDEDFTRFNDQNTCFNFGKKRFQLNNNLELMEIESHSISNPSNSSKSLPNSSNTYNNNRSNPNFHSTTSHVPHLSESSSLLQTIPEQEVFSADCQTTSQPGSTKENPYNQDKFFFSQKPFKVGLGREDHSKDSIISTPSKKEIKQSVVTESPLVRYDGSSSHCKEQNSVFSECEFGAVNGYSFNHNSFGSAGGGGGGGGEKKYFSSIKKSQLTSQSPQNEQFDQQIQNIIPSPKKQLPQQYQTQQQQQSQQQQQYQQQHEQQHQQKNNLTTQSLQKQNYQSHQQLQQQYQQSSQQGVQAQNSNSSTSIKHKKQFSLTEDMDSNLKDLQSQFTQLQKQQNSLMNQINHPSSQKKHPDILLVQNESQFSSSLHNFPQKNSPVICSYKPNQLHSSSSSATLNPKSQLISPIPQQPSKFSHQNLSTPFLLQSPSLENQLQYSYSQNQLIHPVGQIQLYSPPTQNIQLQCFQASLASSVKSVNCFSDRPATSQTQPNISGRFSLSNIQGNKQIDSSKGQMQQGEISTAFSQTFDQKIPKSDRNNIDQKHLKKNMVGISNSQGKLSYSRTEKNGGNFRDKQNLIDKPISNSFIFSGEKPHSLLEKHSITHSSTEKSLTNLNSNTSIPTFNQHKTANHLSHSSTNPQEKLSSYHQRKSSANIPTYSSTCISGNIGTITPSDSLSIFQQQNLLANSNKYKSYTGFLKHSLPPSSFVDSQLLHPQSLTINNASNQQQYNQMKASQTFPASTVEQDLSSQKILQLEKIVLELKERVGQLEGTNSFLLDSMEKLLSDKHLAKQRIESIEKQTESNSKNIAVFSKLVSKGTLLKGDSSTRITDISSNESHAESNFPHLQVKDYGAKLKIVKQQDVLNLNKVKDNSPKKQNISPKKGKNNQSSKEWDYSQKQESQDDTPKKENYNLLQFADFEKQGKSISSIISPNGNIQMHLNSLSSRESKLKKKESKTEQQLLGYGKSNEFTNSASQFTQYSSSSNNNNNITNVSNQNKYFLKLSDSQYKSPDFLPTNSSCHYPDMIDQFSQQSNNQFTGGNNISAPKMSKSMSQPNHNLPISVSTSQSAPFSSLQSQIFQGGEANRNKQWQQLLFKQYQQEQLISPNLQGLISKQQNKQK